MSSGEADVAEATRRMLAQSRSLDAFRRCAISGCEVRVHLSGNGRCQAHGGPRDGVPEYLTAADGGAFIYARQISLPPEDCE